MLSVAFSSLLKTGNLYGARSQTGQPFLSLVLDHKSSCHVLQVTFSVETTTIDSVFGKRVLTHPKIRGKLGNSDYSQMDGLIVSLQKCPK